MSRAILPLPQYASMAWCSVKSTGITLPLPISKFILLRLTTHTDEIIWNHQYVYRHNRATNGEIFYIRQIPEKTWKCNDTVHRLFIDSKKPYYSFRGRVV
jgi:hypothetical protein